MDSKQCNNISREDLLMRIREIQFLVIDFNLFLDNHPQEKQVLNEYNKATKQLISLKKMYEVKFGVLTNFGYSTSQYPWTWINEPWPWENGI